MSEEERNKAYEKAYRIAKMLGVAVREERADGSYITHKPSPKKREVKMKDIVRIIME